ncbi:MAG: PIN domain-containing protein [Candidatus Woesearchaeota archaeon]
MKLLDTTYLIDLLNNKEDAYKKLDDLDHEPALFITAINIFELVAGVYKRYNENREQKIEELLKFLSDFEILDLDLVAALKAGKIKGSLIKTGSEIDIGDCLIGGIALANKVNTIITKNKKHFERIEGLNVETY